MKEWEMTGSKGLTRETSG